MISDELHLDVSFNTLQRFSIQQQAELDNTIQLINSSNYNFPAKHYNLSIVDARYLQNHTDEILRILQIQSDLYEAPSNYGHNENMGTRAKMAKYPSRHAMTFLQFIKNVRKLNEELIDWYHNNYQVVYYAEYNN